MCGAELTPPESHHIMYNMKILHNITIYVLNYNDLVIFVRKEPVFPEAGDTV